jgi:hypothetical protein
MSGLVETKNSCFPRGDTQLIWPHSIAEKNQTGYLSTPFVPIRDLFLAS